MRTHPSAPEEIVIIGGNGKTGRRVAALLRAQGRAVRPVSRSTSPSFDWNETTTWAAALEGASAAYITYSPDLALPGADEQLRQLGRLLAGMDVTRVVLLSGRGEPGAVVSENALREQVPTARVVRSSFFMQNFTEGMLIEFVSDGVIAMPVPGTVPEPFIDVDDVAEVVVATLLDDSKARGVLEVTGPASITFTDVAATFSQELGREVAFQEVSPQAFVERWVAAGLRSRRSPWVGRDVRRVDGRSQLAPLRRSHERSGPPGEELPRLCPGRCLARSVADRCRTGRQAPRLVEGAGSGHGVSAGGRVRWSRGTARPARRSAPLAAAAGPARSAGTALRRRAAGRAHPCWATSQRRARPSR